MILIQRKTEFKKKLNLKTKFKRYKDKYKNNKYH